MEAKQQVRMIVEYPYHGGEHAEVLEVSIQDLGGNVWWSGPIEDYDESRLPKTPYRIVATKLGKLSGCYSESYAHFAEL